MKEKYQYPGYSLVALAALGLVGGCNGQNGTGESNLGAEPTDEPASSNEQTPAATAPERSIVNVAGDLYRVQNGNHFTVFIVTEEGIILADPINLEAAEWLRGELATRFDLPVRYVLYSHSHWDHASGAAVFDDTATLIGHANMQAEIETARSGLPTMVGIIDSNGDGFMDREETSGELSARFALFDRNNDGRVSGEELMADVIAPEHTYTEQATIRLGGKTVDLVHPGPNHSTDMTVLVFREERVLYGVDFVNVKRLAFGFPGTGTTDEWVASLRAVEALDFDIVTPGHSSTGTKSDFAEYRRFFEELDTAVDLAVSEGTSLDALLASDVLSSYSHMPNYDPQRNRNLEEAYRLLTE